MLQTVLRLPEFILDYIHRALACQFDLGSLRDLKRPYFTPTTLKAHSRLTQATTKKAQFIPENFYLKNLFNYF